MEGDGGEELCIWDIYSWGFEPWRPSRPLLLKYTPWGYVSQYVSHTSLSPVTPSIFFKIISKLLKKIPKIPSKITQKPTKSPIKSA